ncbi:MAG TPA: hypothetical protein VFZ98_01440, partial [Vicinamibacterales bacterium]
MSVDRREFLIASAFAVGAASARVAAAPVADAAKAVVIPDEKDRLRRIASCTWPIRYIFRARGQSNPANQQLKQKYGEITMLDFPQFTKDTFPGVTHMDLFSGLFGDITDDSMFTSRQDGRPGTFDPSTESGKKWLDRLVAKMVATGTHCQHISNNAPTNLA